MKKVFLKIGLTPIRYGDINLSMTNVILVLNGNQYFGIFNGV